MEHFYVLLQHLVKLRRTPKFPRDAAEAFDSWLQSPFDKNKHDALMSVSSKYSEMLENLEISPAGTLNDELVLANICLFGALRFCTYGLTPSEAQTCRTAFQHASTLCMHALYACKNDADRIRWLLIEYFDDLVFFHEKAIAALKKVATSLGNTVVVVCPGDHPKANDARAYVDEREDQLAKEHLPNPPEAAFIKVVKSAFFATTLANRSNGASSSGVASPEIAMSRGVTLLHEMTHLFAETHDVEASSDVQQKLPAKAPKLKECYGRIYCRALAKANGAFAANNADSLAFFALDTYLFQTKQMSLERLIHVT